MRDGRTQPSAMAPHHLGWLVARETTCKRESCGACRDLCSQQTPQVRNRAQVSTKQWRLHVDRNQWQRKLSCFFGPALSDFRGERCIHTLNLAVADDLQMRQGRMVDDRHTVLRASSNLRTACLYSFSPLDQHSSRANFALATTPCIAGAVNSTPDNSNCQHSAHEGKQTIDPSAL